MKVAVLMGGVSHEHPVSLKSGKNIAAALITLGHEVFPVVIERSGRWSFSGAAVSREALEDFVESPPKGVFPELAVAQLRESGAEVVFPALHGPGGEDGAMQGFLETLGFPFVGSDHIGAALSSDKLISKALYESARLPVAPHVTILPDSPPELGLTFGLPVVLKAPSQGSSFGLTIAKTEEAYYSELKRLLIMEGRVLAEKFIKGREITCGVLELPDGRLRGLPPTEIVPRVSDYFDFAAKYEEGGSDEITPARITEAQTARAQSLAVQAHTVLRMRGLSRTDFILDGESFYLLETNALPGFTATSLYPQAAREAGFSFPEIVEHLVKRALNS